MVLLTFCACSLFRPLPPSDSAFRPLEEISGDLITLGWLRPDPSDANRPLLVVIEGDGAAWGSDNTPPPDPTPRSGLGARLASALADEGPVLYLARPGQYLSARQSARCSMRHWTDQRFGNAAVAALAALIDRAQVPHRKVVLIGFSGGGVLAAELALRRHDVAALITVAAPLDPAAWTRLHRISPLTAPGDLPVSLARAPFPQCHFYGARDRVVPPTLVSALAGQLPVHTVRLIDGRTHGDDGWILAVAGALRSLRANGGMTGETTEGAKSEASGIQENIRS